MDFCDKVKSVRAELKLSQQAFARELGVAYVTINRWENSWFKPNYDAIEKFENFCEKHNIVFQQ